jgi:hypothetical protein
MASRGIKLRSWAIRAEDYIDDNGYDTGFRAAVKDELRALEHMGERLGVGFVSAPVRKEVSPGLFETVGWMFQTETIPVAETWQPAPIALGDSDGTGEDVVEDERLSAALAE